MKRSFEELAGLDQDVIVQKSHIVHSTLDDVIHKRFSKFNPVKAKGIANTLENEFNIDMGGWLNEYNNYRDNKQETVSTIEKAAMEAIEESNLPKKKLFKTILLVCAIIGIGYIVLTSGTLSNLGSEQNMTDEQYKAELNKTEEANATAAALALSTDNNGTLPNVALPNTVDVNATKTDTNTTVKPAEANKTMATSTPIVAPPPALTPAPIAPSNKLIVESTHKLWYKVINLDTNKTEDATIEAGKIEIDATKPKIVIFGHQQTKLTLGQTIIESRHGSKIRYLLKDKKLTPIGEDEEYKLQGKTKPQPKPAVAPLVPAATAKPQGVQ